MSEPEFNVDLSCTPPRCLPAALDATGFEDISQLNDAWAVLYDPTTGAIHRCAHYWEIAQQAQRLQRIQRREKVLVFDSGQDIDNETMQLARDLTAEYPVVRILPDGSIAAIWPLVYTTSIVLGLTRHGWARRYCFKEAAVAIQRLSELKTEDEEPAGYVARR